MIKNITVHVYRFHHEIITFLSTLPGGQDRHMGGGLVRLNTENIVGTNSDKTDTGHLCYALRMRNDTSRDKTESFGSIFFLDRPDHQVKSLTWRPGLPK